MPGYFLSEIYVYPVKSAAGISVKESFVEERGLKFDRRWMLVDAGGKFISQRTCPQLSLVSVEIADDGLIIKHKIKDYGSVFVPFDIDEDNFTEVQIWKDSCSAVSVSNAADCWFGKVLGFPCRLVFMPEHSKRKVDLKYSSGKETVSFADGFPFLLIGQSSLDDLNSKLEKALPMNRFRPNLVFTGGEPFAEDNWKRFKIGDSEFCPVKPCSRCIVPTIDQESGIKGTELLETLAAYRKKGNKVLFGQNLIHSGGGIIKVGDPLIVLE